MRGGDLPPVSVPSVEDAASRELSRARAEARPALTAATVRLQACRLRQDSRSTGRATWSPAPLRGRSEVVCPPRPAHRRPGRWPGRARTHRATSARCTSTPRAGQRLARASGGRSPAGPAGHAVARGRDPRRGTRGPHPRRHSQTTPAVLGAPPLGGLEGGEAPSGRPHPRGSSPGPSGARGRGLGLA
jgi:hypothetical protein